MSDSSVRIRAYQDSDKTALLSIFEANIREEWGDRYHKGQYVANATRYIETVTANEASDLYNIPRVYLEPGGAFWVLVDEDYVVGMVGIQVLPQAEGEIRRNCILPAYRGKGWGTKLCQQIQEMAREKSLKRLCCSTPEHGDDVLRFYNRLGFAEFGERQELHGTPIKEVFLEWYVK
jgi:ribosomal protein S18 acetylase RimI-like enzyme